MESHGKGNEYRASEDRALAVLLVIAEDEAETAEARTAAAGLLLGHVGVKFDEDSAAAEFIKAHTSSEET